MALSPPRPTKPAVLRVTGTAQVGAEVAVEGDLGTSSEMLCRFRWLACPSSDAPLVIAALADSRGRLDAPAEALLRPLRSARGPRLLVTPLHAGLHFFVAVWPDQPADWPCSDRRPFLVPSKAPVPVPAGLPPPRPLGTLPAQSGDAAESPSPPAMQLRRLAEGGAEAATSSRLGGVSASTPPRAGGPARGGPARRALALALRIEPPDMSDEAGGPALGDAAVGTAEAEAAANTLIETCVSAFLSPPLPSPSEALPMAPKPPDAVVEHGSRCGDLLVPCLYQRPAATCGDLLVPETPLLWPSPRPLLASPRVASPPPQPLPRRHSAELPPAAVLALALVAAALFWLVHRAVFSQAPCPAQLVASAVAVAAGGAGLGRWRAGLRAVCRL